MTDFRVIEMLDAANARGVEFGIEHFAAHMLAASIRSAKCMVDAGCGRALTVAVIEAMMIEACIAACQLTSDPKESLKVVSAVIKAGGSDMKDLEGGLHGD